LYLLVDTTSFTIDGDAIAAGHRQVPALQIERIATGSMGHVPTHSRRVGKRVALRVSRGKRCPIFELLADDHMRVSPRGANLLPVADGATASSDPILSA